MNRIIFTTIAIFLALFSSCTTNSESTVGTNRDIERKIDRLISKMTLEEKIGQMNQSSVQGEASSLAAYIREGNLGSILNEIDPVKINEYQRIAVNESRLGIPILFGRDVIHGFNTIFPIPLGLAATFNPALVEEGARTAAREATAYGVRWTFSPMLDLSRDPRWGRIAEGSGEDPYLDLTIGLAMVRGYQQPAEGDLSLAACVKHFVGYGASEGGRDYNSTFIPERQLRNFYLPPFEATIKEGAMTIMTSFNDNDGVPSTGNSFILKDILKDEWKFDGFVVSDWSSTAEMIAHGFASDLKDAGAKAVNAGTDMDMMSYSYITYLKELVKEGTVKESTIDDAVRRILRVKFILGLFDNPYVNVKKSENASYTSENLAVALKTAEESVILLKNDNETLPIDDSQFKSILITGPMADAPFDQMGTWSFDGKEQNTITPLAAITKDYGEKLNIIFEPGLTFSRDKREEGIAKAVAAAASADLILVFAGEEAILSGEAHCLADISLTGAQTELIKALKATGKKVITTIMAGRPLSIGEEAACSDALLFSFHPGTMGGPALANLIFGKAVPSGKTPITFPISSGQIPIYYNHKMTGRPFIGNETLLDNIPEKAGQTSLGNTSFYLDQGAYPLYPFGYGLSYTTFEYTNISIDKEVYSKDDTINISFILSNRGKYDGAEIAQLYVRDLVGSVTRPVKELKRYEKIFLAAGESRQLTMSLPVSELAFWNIDLKYEVEPGDFQLWLGTDSKSGSPIGFKVR